MLTVMCPNCRHRFPASGCCNPNILQMENTTTTTSSSATLTTATTAPQPSSKNTIPAMEALIGTCGNNNNYYGCSEFLFPREYKNIGGGGGCFINAPTIINSPTIIQSNNIGNTNNNNNNNNNLLDTPYGMLNIEKYLRGQEKNLSSNYEKHINTTNDLTGGTVTITTPNIQSGGCLIQRTDCGILVQAPRIEIRPKLSASGGGCLVQEKLSTDDNAMSEIIFNDTGYSEILSNLCNFDNNLYNQDKSLPSGCQELPGIRKNIAGNKIPPKNNDFFHSHPHNHHHHHHQQQQQRQQQQQPQLDRQNSNQYQEETDSSMLLNNAKRSCCECSESSNDNQKRLSSCYGSRPTSCHGNLSSTSFCTTTAATTTTTSNGKTTPKNSGETTTNTNENNTDDSASDNPKSFQIQVNATVQLPPNIGHCTLNITATTNQNNNVNSINVNSNNNSDGDLLLRSKNNFNGGGLVHQIDNNNPNINTFGDNNERREDSPTTPISWIMPLPWGFDTYPMDKDSLAKIAEFKRLLQTVGWYYEGVSWQQSEELLKNVSIGGWLLRDSSDNRYTFAITVQTNRGPTSVRVVYSYGHFRLDAEPRLAIAMPQFNCPIKLLDYYIKYSTWEKNRREVWVDFSGQIYSQIYLTKPLVKQVRPLSHLARLVINQHKSIINTDNLPPLIKNFIAEYPYTF